eukprot:750733-Hanusia_phi.AAC.9
MTLRRHIARQQRRHLVENRGSSRPRGDREQDRRVGSTSQRRAGRQDRGDIDLQKDRERLLSNLVAALVGRHPQRQSLVDKEGASVLLAVDRQAARGLVQGGRAVKSVVEQRIRGQGAEADLDLREVDSWGVETAEVSQLPAECPAASLVAQVTHGLIAIAAGARGQATVAAVPQAFLLVVERVAVTVLVPLESADLLYDVGVVEMLPRPSWTHRPLGAVVGEEGRGARRIRALDEAAPDRGAGITVRAEAVDLRRTVSLDCHVRTGRGDAFESFLHHTDRAASVAIQHVAVVARLFAHDDPIPTGCRADADLVTVVAKLRLTRPAAPVSAPHVPVIASFCPDNAQVPADVGAVARVACAAVLHRPAQPSVLHRATRAATVSVHPVPIIALLQVHEDPIPAGGRAGPKAPVLPVVAAGVSQLQLALVEPALFHETVARASVSVPGVVVVTAFVRRSIPVAAGGSADVSRGGWQGEVCEGDEQGGGGKVDVHFDPLAPHRFAVDR